MSETITVTGNVATDPERRAVGEGVSVTSFRLAATHRRFDRGTNSWVDAYTNYYSVSAFRSLGEHALSSLRRGERVIVSGRFRLREWDNGTRKGVSAEIDAESIGHDLLFGSTTFHRDGEPRSSSTSESVGSGERERAEQSPHVDADGWVIPAALETQPDHAREHAETPF